MVTAMVAMMAMMVAMMELLLFFIRRKYSIDYLDCTLNNFYKTPDLMVRHWHSGGY